MNCTVPIALSNCLHSARTFETAGEHLLRAMFDTAAVSLGKSELGTDVLRGTIHVRPDNEYRRLFNLEFGNRDCEAQLLQLPSLTAWRWIASRGCPVGIDVRERLLSVFEAGSPRLLRDPATAVALNTGETCQRLTAREAEYVLVYPLRRHAGMVDGMVSLELRMANGSGTDLHSDCGAALQVLVNLAAPHLASLPCASVAAHSFNSELLPVVGDSMAPLVELLQVFARLEETLLIMGPTGVGKSRLARYCHALSSRRDKPFVTLDLLSCPADLQMAQLCGSKRGAYTGAERDVVGAVQRAEGGTLFIDEVDKLSVSTQAGLLRLLEDRVYRPIGASGDDRKANVRFMVGTIANLRESVTQGKFREDLYYRLAVLVVRVPPLSQRADEIVEWAKFMLARCAGAANQGNGGRTVLLDDSAHATLRGYGWPGNLRQLDNVVRRAYAYSLLMGGDAADAEHVSAGHVERAMADEEGDQPQSSDPRSAVRLMQLAARAYASEALLRAQSQQPLELSLADAFRAMVLEATIEASGNDRDAALLALGLGNVIRDRNQHRVLRREAELLRRFHASVTQTGAPATFSKRQ